MSDAQQKERGKDGAVSWAHAFHGACEKEDLSNGEKLFSKAYLLTRHPLDQTLGSTLSYRQKSSAIRHVFRWNNDSLLDRNTGKQSQNPQGEAIP